MRLCAACVLALVLSARPASPQPPAAPTLESLQRTLDEQRVLIAQQAEALETQRRALEALQQRLDALKRDSPATAVEQTLDARLAAVERIVERLPELPQKLVTGGEFPGSITIPGTDAAFRIGGRLQMTAIHTMQPLGTDDRFITSSIPVGADRPGDAARTDYTATPSRLNLDLRSPWPFGTMRTFIEADFAGDGNTARLRHAYMQTRRWLFGQTWSTFADPEAQPIELDFEGLNAISRFRQAQIRYSRDLSERVNLALALEDPAPDLSDASGVNLIPDFTARLRWQFGDATAHATGDAPHLHVAVLARGLRGELVDVGVGTDPGQPNPTLATGGFGVNVSGVVVPPWYGADRIRFGTNDGWGIGRYIKDLEALGGQDAVYDPVLGQLRALPVLSAYVAYERVWRPTFSSTFTYGGVRVDNLDIQPPSSLRSTQRVTLNIVWNPMPRSDLILEFLTGRRTNKDGEHASSSQFQGGWRVRF